MNSILVLPSIELVVIGALCGLVGVFAVLGRRVFFAESVTHATFPGAVIGVVLGGKNWLFVGALAMCAVMAAMMRKLSSIKGQSSQAAAGIVLTVGFALGYFLAKFFAPLPVRIEAFLAGSVLGVRVTDIGVALAVLVACLIVLAFFGRDLIFYCFDATGFRASGGRAGLAEGIILTMIVATVVAVIPAVGTILSIALVVAPGAGLVEHIRRPGLLLVAAPIAGSVISVVGLAIAVAADISIGGTIAVVAGVFYLLCMSPRFLIKRRTT